MKKIVIIILCLLCAITASALSYASPYKGAGRNGYIHIGSPMHMHSGSAGLAQVPTAAIASTRSSFGSERGVYEGGAIPSAPIIRGISTSASSVQGGVTTYDSGDNPPSGPRRSGTPPLPGLCDQCDWQWSDEYDDYVCSVCGSHAQWGCDHVHDYGYCWCPIELDWKAMFFMAALAGAYAIYKVRTGKKEII